MRSWFPIIRKIKQNAKPVELARFFRYTISYETTLNFNRLADMTQRKKISVAIPWFLLGIISLCLFAMGSLANSADVDTTDSSESPTSWQVTQDDDSESYSSDNDTDESDSGSWWDWISESDSGSSGSSDDSWSNSGSDNDSWSNDSWDSGSDSGGWDSSDSGSDSGSW